ncbi:MAG TPA: hypothetical protein VMJ70_09045 [Candidatus Sulfotelmatobacter sp.]|nr:hypothetical protein [Candidatus Sulfotelmatobacter sp.]
MKAEMHGSAQSGRTALWLALAAFLVFAATGGGRIAGSDEVTMFEVSSALLRGSVAVPEGATLEGRDGRFYSKNAAGQALLALPLVAAGETAARASGLPPERRVLAARFVASFFNAILTAAMLGAFYAGVRALGVSAGASLAAALLLGFTTPTWVYAKSFMAEPMEALGMLLALSGSASALTGDARAVRLAALGAFLAVSAKLVLIALVIPALLPLLFRRSDGARVPGLAWVLGALALALAGQLVYNVARFGTPLETGYGAQVSPAAFRTPMLVGLYGLLLSSGKGVVWFAPAIVLAVPGLARMTRRAGGDRNPRAVGARGAATAIVTSWIVGLLIYSRFEHWAGDGSFGPRYLVPLLPLAFVAVAFALDGASRAMKRWAWVLAALGLAVQIGGVFIYFGAQMREAGDYPYRLPLEDPRFMSDSHFNPRFSPIAGHWKMLARNAGEHLRGELPVITGGGAVDPRLGISPDEQRALLHGIDVWWLYARYAGVPALPLALALALLIALAAWAGGRAATACHAEARGG